MFYLPLNYADLNNLAGHYSPSMVKAYNNATYAYWERSLFQRACSKIKTTLPENWEGSRRDFLLYCLLKLGFVFVSKNDRVGYWFNPGSLYGIDFYYQPTEFILANPRAYDVLGVDKSTRFRLHEEGELLKFMPDYMGIFDIISYYAEKLSALDSAINMSIINNKFCFILAGKNKATVEALKKMFDKINKGEPAVFLDKALANDPTDQDQPWQFIELQKLKDNYITDKQLIDFQTILNAFDAEIGINTVPYQKAERFVSAEADSRRNDSQARITCAIECLKSSIKDIRKLYPDITLDFNLREEEMQNGNGKMDTDGNVPLR